MNAQLRRIWAHPRMEKWGRIALLFLAVLPCFWYFAATGDTRNEAILVLIITALTAGVSASIATTERYTSRSLGLLGVILAADLYFIYLYLLFVYGNDYQWMIAFTRALFVISAPLFAIATVVALIRRTRDRRNERRTLS
jgi:hypothetical protein